MSEPKETPVANPDERIRRAAAAPRRRPPRRPPAAAADSPRAGSPVAVAASVPAPAAPTDEWTPTAPEAVTGPEPAAGARASRLSARRRLVVPVLALLAVLLAVAVTLSTLSVSSHRAEARARVDALAAAKTAATAVLSASYRTVDNDIAAARKDLTPRFRQQYDRIAQASFRQMVVDNQAIITAQVEAGGVKLASPDRVVVLLFINQLSTNNKRPVPRLDQPRVRMTMVRQGGRWLVDGMDAI